MNSKKAITLLVLATLMMALVPAVSVKASVTMTGIYIGSGSDPISWAAYDYTTTRVAKSTWMYVEGTGVTAGATVAVYWDNAFKESFTSGSGKLNSTTASSAGTFELWFKAPEAKWGKHYVWVKDVSTGTTYGGVDYPDESLVKVGTKLTYSPSSGLPKDTITVTGNGFGSEKDITMSSGFPTGATFSPTTPKTSTLGTFTTTFKVPTDAVLDADTTVTATQNGTVLKAKDIYIGASITLSVDHGPSGLVLQITGRGFTGSASLAQGAVVLDPAGEDLNCYILNAPITIKPDGTFKISVVIPAPSDTGDYDVQVDDGIYTASDTFTVEGLPAVKATPGYGAQGSYVTVEGFNFTQITNTNVVVELGGENTKTFKTDSKGYFKANYQVPAVDSGNRDLTADQTDYNIYAEKTFRVGLMLVILSPNEGPAGSRVSLTGTGFTADGMEDPIGSARRWNATLNGEEWFSEADVATSGTISDTAYVPSVAPGTYQVVVWDKNPEITVVTTFKVTKNTYVTPDPMVAPNGYPVTLKGYFFAADDNDAFDVGLDWVLWNATNSWTMDVVNKTKLGVESLSFVLDTGNFTSYWDVPSSDTLSLGTYWVNVTDDEGMYYQFQFDIVTKTTAITARKATFKIGEVVAFNVESSFKQEDSYIKIWDPSGNLYWKTDLFVTGNWMKVGTLQVYPFYQQTAGGNPMTLLEDAPLGTYTWKWYDVDDEVVSSGTFIAAAAAEDVLGKQITDLNTAVTGLTTDISTVSTEMAAVKTQITSAINAANAAVTAANAATQAVNAVAQTASAASQAATQAATAATEAKNAANGLTTLVYGAIGASLVAALAAIVSLMQISRRIAG